ncbi:MAG: efflux RND transporter permease subunit, partial [Mesorhizobium sp.]
FGLGLEIFHHETTINAPSTQWWISLSSAIVFGLSFATLLTLVVTPSMLMVFTRAKVKPGQRRGWFGRLFRSGKGEVTTGAPAGETGTEPAVAFPKAAE